MTLSEKLVEIQHEVECLRELNKRDHQEQIAALDHEVKALDRVLARVRVLEGNVTRGENLNG